MIAAVSTVVVIILFIAVVVAWNRRVEQWDLVYIDRSGSMMPWFDKSIDLGRRHLADGGELWFFADEVFPSTDVMRLGSTNLQAVVDHAAGRKALIVSDEEWTNRVPMQANLTIINPMENL